MPKPNVSPRALAAVRQVCSMDSAESIHAAGQLTEVITSTYALKLPPLMSGQMFDVDNTPDPGLERVEVSRVDMIGGASEGNRNGENSVDRVDLVETADGRRVMRYTNVYGFSVDELERAGRRKVPLQATKGQAARYIHNQKGNSLVFEGAVGIPSLFNDPNIPVIVAPKKISAMTGEEILQYVNQWTQQARDQTYGRFVIDSISSTPAVMGTIGTKLITGTAATTASVLFSEYGSKLSNRYSAYEMNQDGDDYMLIYAKDRMAGLVRNPLPFRQLPPQSSGTMTDIYCMSASAGFVVSEPGAYLLIRGV